jgi:hypothetical protein
MSEIGAHTSVRKSKPIQTYQRKKFDAAFAGCISDSSTEHGGAKVVF